MYVQVDVSQVPPVTTVHDTGDFSGFEVRIVATPEVSVDPALIRAAAGDVSGDWEERFGAMVAYAASKGWVDDDGQIKAHVVMVPRDDDS
jgi:hypothetical protein